jgi:hypothetical protein
MTKTIVIRTDTRQAGTCRSCGAAIEWAVIPKSGKRMPFNRPLVLLPIQALGTEVAIRHYAEVDMRETTSHFATCPQAQQWRRR